MEVGTTIMYCIGILCLLTVAERHKGSSAQQSTLHLVHLMALQIDSAVQLEPVLVQDGHGSVFIVGVDWKFVLRPIRTIR